VRQLRAEGWEAVPYASATEFLERASLADVGCVLLDNQMPGMSGIELLERLAGDGAAPPVVFLSGNGDVATGVHVMKLGALDFLTKPVEHGVLVAAVRKALARHAGERALMHEREACRALVDRLSVREREVMAHVIRGRLNKQIAADLDIAEQTVKQHRGRVMEKIGVRSVPELVRICEGAALFVPDPAVKAPGSH
jgi:FixJ family two-component response regulator